MATKTKTKTKFPDNHPPAMFVKPMARFRLVRPEATGMGYPLIDVIAILPPVKSTDSKFPFPYLVCMALGSSGEWHLHEIVDGDGHVDLAECYEAVGGMP